MRAVVQRTVVAVISMIVAVVLLENLMITIAMSEDGEPAFYADVVELPGSDPAAIPAGDPVRCRELVVEVDGEELRVRYHLRTPANHPLYEALRTGRGYGGSRGFVREYLGEVWISEYPAQPAFQNYRPEWQATFDEPVTEGSDDTHCGNQADGPGRITVTATVARLDHGSFRLRVRPPASGLRAGSDTFIVRGAESASDSAAVSLRSVATDRDGRVFTFTRGEGEALLSVSAAGSDSARASLLTVAKAELVPVDSALYKLGILLPYLLVLWLIRAATRHGVPTGRRTRRCVEALIGAGVAFAVLDTLLEATGWLPGWRWYTWWRGDTADSEGVAADVAGAGVSILLTVAVLVWWPAAIHRGRSPSPGGPAPAGRLWATAAGAALAGAIAIGLEAVPDNGVRTSAAHAAATAAAYVVAVPLVFFAAARCVFGFAKSILVAALSGMLATAAALGVASGWSVDQRLFPLACVGVYAAGLGVLGARLPWRRLTTASASIPSGTEVAVFGAVVVASLLDFAWYVLTRRDTPTGSWLTLYLVDWLGTVDFYLLLAALVITLAQIHRSVAARGRPALVRLAGASLAATTFYWTDQLFWLPVTIMIGAAWTAWITVRPNSRPGRFAERVAVSANHLARERRVAVDARQRRIDELDPPSGPAATAASIDDCVKYFTDATALDERIRRLPERVSPGAAVPVLASRLTGGGWTHGRYAAAVGAVIGLPWALIYLYRLIGAAYVADFPLLGFLGYGAWLVIQWPLYGFFYGYFYPHIRGDSGIAKSLHLFLAICAPPLLYQLVFDRGDEWLAYGLGVAQTLLFACLLGLIAGDHRLMRRVGFGIRHILGVYQTRYLIALGGTATVAVLGVVATLVSGVLPLILQERESERLPRHPHQPVSTVRLHDVVRWVGTVTSGDPWVR